MFRKYPNTNKWSFRWVPRTGEVTLVWWSSQGCSSKADSMPQICNARDDILLYGGHPMVERTRLQDIGCSDWWNSWSDTGVAPLSRSTMPVSSDSYCPALSDTGARVGCITSLLSWPTHHICRQAVSGSACPLYTLRLLMTCHAGSHLKIGVRSLCIYIVAACLSGHSEKHFLSSQ